MLRAVGETGPTQGNRQDWLWLGDGDPGFENLTEEEIATVLLFIYLFISIIKISKLFSVF